MPEKRQDGDKRWRDYLALAIREGWPDPVGFAKRRMEECEKCGRAMNGEIAYVDGQYWCHPCADRRL